MVKPEILLAEAVVRLAVKDVLHGARDRRKQARADIAEGCLDYWVEVVCSEGRGPSFLLDALYALT